MEFLNEAFEVALKGGDVQSSFCGDMSFKSDIGITSRMMDTCAFSFKNSADLFLES